MRRYCAIMGVSCGSGDAIARPKFRVQSFKVQGPKWGHASEVGPRNLVPRKFLGPSLPAFPVRCDMVRLNLIQMANSKVLALRMAAFLCAAVVPMMHAAAPSAVTLPAQSISSDRATLKATVAA